MLKNKQQQAEVAMKIAYAEKNREDFLAAQQAQLQAINDYELRKIKIYTDGKALLDKIRSAKDDEYNKQLLQNQAFQVYKDQTEQYTILQQENNKQAKEIANQIADAQRAGNKALEDKLKLEKLSLYNQNVSLQKDKDEMWNAGMAAKEEVKTEKELEAIAARKAKQAERKSAADAAAKKLAEDILAIEQRMAELQRASMDEQEQELFTMFERQKVEEQTFIKAKKSADELAQLRATHEAEFAAITAKYDQVESDKDAEKKLKEQEDAAQKLEEKKKELADLQAIIDAADKGNIESTATQQERELIASQEYYLTLKEQAKAAGLDATALTEEQARKENEIKEKYRKEDAAKAKAAQDFRNDQIKQSLTALIALNDSFTARTEKTARRQFNVNKALAMASALFDTYTAINKALNDETMPSTAARIIQASIVGVMGFANVAKISKTQFGGATPDTSSNTPAGGGTGASQSNAPAVDFSGANMQTNAPGGVETYVLAGNVANALEARQKIIDQSYL